MNTPGCDVRLRIEPRHVALMADAGSGRKAVRP